MSAHRERERLPASPKRPHQQIWSAATVRLGHNSEGAYFNQRHASLPTSPSFKRSEWIVVCMKGNTRRDRPRCSRSSVGLTERADWSDTPHQWRRWYWQEERLQRRSVRRNSLEELCLLFGLLGEASAPKSPLADRSVQWLKVISIINGTIYTRNITTISPEKKVDTGQFCKWDPKKSGR